MEETPAAVNKANAFANAAEEYTERNQYDKAVEAHFRAAEQFLLATSYTSDPEAVKTLKLLYANHTRQGKDLQRRLQQSQNQQQQQQQRGLSAGVSGKDGGGGLQQQQSPQQQSQQLQNQQQQQRGGGTSVGVGVGGANATTIKGPAATITTASGGGGGGISLQNTRSGSGGGGTSSANTNVNVNASRGGGVGVGGPATLPATNVGGMGMGMGMGGMGMGMGGGQIKQGFDVEGVGSVYGSRQFFVGQSRSGSTIISPDEGNGGGGVGGGAGAGRDFRVNAGRGTSGVADYGYTPATVAVESLDDSDPQNHPVQYDSIDQSYFVLDEKSQEGQDDEPEDPFNKFWDAVENLVQRISVTGPVAFTTAPLPGQPQPPYPGLTNTPASIQPQIQIQQQQQQLGIGGGGGGLSGSGERRASPSPMNLQGGVSTRPSVVGRGATNTYPGMDGLRDVGGGTNNPMSDTLRSTMLNSYFVVPKDGIGASYMSNAGYGSYALTNDAHQMYLRGSGNVGGGVSGPAGGGVVVNHGGVSGGAGLHPSVNVNVGGGGGDSTTGENSPAPPATGANTFGLDSNVSWNGGAGSGGVGKGLSAAAAAAIAAANKASGEAGGMKRHALSSSKTIEELMIENDQLKQTVDYLAKRIAFLEKAAEENNLLRSSIMQFRQDVQRQAKL
ncbi:hypothetical protein HDU76_006955, partial [Blyttiomyces sp. JEL0837]